MLGGGRRMEPCKALGAAGAWGGEREWCGVPWGEGWVRKASPMAAAESSRGGDAGSGLCHPQARPWVAGKGWAMGWQPCSALGQLWGARGLPTLCPAFGVQPLCIPSGDHGKPGIVDWDRALCWSGAAIGAAWVRLLLRATSANLSASGGRGCKALGKSQINRKIPQIRVPPSTPARSEAHTEA